MLADVSRRSAALDRSSAAPWLMTWPEVVNTGLVLTLLSVLGASWRLFYTEMRRDRDFWRRMALDSLNLADKATSVAASRGDG